MVSAMRISSSAEQGFSSPQEWDEFTKHFPAGHLLQAWAWGQFKAHFGWQPLRIAAVEGGCILAAAQVMLRPLPASRLTTAYVPKGPLMDHSMPTTSAALLSAIHDVCRRKRAISLKVEPEWEDGTEERIWLEAQGFIPSEQTVQPRRTVVIDLTLDEEAILAQMKSKTRYNIRLARRKGVCVRPGTADDLSTFYELLKATGRRAQFGIHTQAYYTQVWRLFAAQESVALLLAQYGGKPLAALMVFAWGNKAWYMYGASSDEERQRMPTHLLQWEAMRWARERGCETYDLWGIPDVDESEIGPHIASAEERGVLSTGMGGLYRFKRGFGGREVRYVGAYDYVYNQPLYHLLRAAWNWRGR
jgi:peptidoglycan pentaglycine glycine transferase (the first glycine)